MVVDPNTVEIHLEEPVAFFLSLPELNQILKHVGPRLDLIGKLLLDNLRVTFKLWQARQHPSDCPTCREIWGAKKARR